MPAHALSRRYVGLDLGTTNTSVCATSFNQARNQFEEPEAIRAATARSLLLLDERAQRVVVFGEPVYQEPDYLDHPERVREEFKIKIGHDPEADRCVTLLCQALLPTVEEYFNVGRLAADEFCTTVGAPVIWFANEPGRAEAVRQAVAAAGFPAVEVIPEPVAAVSYHAFLGDFRFARRSQRWLVVDFGGGTTDLAVVETAPGGEHPHVVATFGEVYGGKEFDQLLLEKHVLARHWSGLPPTPSQRLELLRNVRRLKERFSEGVKTGQITQSMTFNVRRTGAEAPAGIANPVRLARAEFESEALAQPLIARFADLLLKGFAESGLGLSDVDRVILTGGSARWYFVHQAAAGLFGREAIVMSINPELTIAKGLALARTGFKVPVEESRPAAPDQHPTRHALALPMEAANAPAPPVEKLETILQAASSVAASELDLARCRREAQTLIKTYALGGGVVALLLSPIPGVSQIPLTIGETHLVGEIAKIYGYALSEKELVVVVAALVAGGTVLKATIMEAATFVPGIGWALKAGVAGGAIKLLGEAAIRFFDERRRRELELTREENL